MKPTDQQISAWLDGMLDKEGTARMDSLAESDEDFAQRAARMRRIDGLVRSAIPEEDTVPQALLERLGLAEARADDKVVSLADARLARQASAPAPVLPGRTGRHGFGRIAAQLLLVGGIGVALAVWGTRPADGPDATYRALSDAPAAGDAAASAVNALVLFEPGTSPLQAQRIVAAAGARIVGAPTETGAFKLAIAPGRQDAVLRTLEENASVVMAEPIGGDRP